MPIAPDETPLPYPDESSGGLFAQLMGGAAPADPGPSGSSFEDEARDLLSRLRALLEADGSLDEQEKVALVQVEGALQKVLAGREKERDDLLRGKTTPSALRRARPVQG